LTLRRLFEDAGIQAATLDGDADLTGITIDSRKAGPGRLFVCMPGGNNDSHAFIPDAVAKGASAVIAYGADGVQRAKDGGVAAALIEPRDFADSIWRLCDVFFGHPTRQMKVVGITGTNGKTTTAWLVRDMLRALGLRAGYLGTLGFHLPDEERELANTTPFTVDLYNLLAEARDRGVEALAIEVSSHALAQKRADGVEFNAAVFTNLTQDHLDFHGSMEEYARAKRRLFEEFPAQTQKGFTAAFNIDDETGALWNREHRASPSITFSSQSPSASLYGEALQVRVDGIRLRLRHQGEVREVEVPLGGDYNVENSLSASAALLALGYSLGQISEVLPQVRPVPGRFEAVRNQTGIGVLVDYAHTPDALEKLLDSVRDLKPSRVITVFGCGGDRDRTKRPLMARAASERSDLTVVTSDNPRTEDPQSILDEVETGIMPGRSSVKILDRREAVHHAVGQAQPGDVVVIAGKGHENYQIIGRTKYPMDDRELAREALALEARG
jgi:UDP-N-acetylmuramyl-tripeptide synthetase